MWVEHRRLFELNCIITESSMEGHKFLSLEEGGGGGAFVDHVTLHHRESPMEVYKNNAIVNRCLQ